MATKYWMGFLSFEIEIEILFARTEAKRKKEEIYFFRINKYLNVKK